MENAITLFIQGHGSENITIPFNNNSLKLLSFAGKPGASGDLGRCEYYNNQPIFTIINNFLNNQYLNHTNLDKESQGQLFSSISQDLQQIYENCDFIYDKGFTETYPVSERIFYFKPNLHETCRLCTNPEESSTENMITMENKDRCIAGRCLTERNKKNLCCPEYGLTVICSSFIEDARFTLAGNSFKERNNANINMKLSNKNYWKNRASNEYKYLVDKIYNQKQISLTELNVLFKSMGFEYIYIFDPSCRYCEIDPLEAEKYRNLELIKPSNRTIINGNTEPIYSSQPTNSFLNNNQTTINKNSNSFVQPIQECINGVCGLFQNKSKIDGGKTKRITRKVFKKRKTNKKKQTIMKKRKTARKTVKKKY